MSLPWAEQLQEGFGAGSNWKQEGWNCYGGRLGATNGMEQGNGVLGTGDNGEERAYRGIELEGQEKRQGVQGVAE